MDIIKKSETKRAFGGKNICTFPAVWFVLNCTIWTKLIIIIIKNVK